jgi:hypothetical protein
MNKEKATLAAEFNKLDLKAESSPLLDEEKEKMKDLAEKLKNIWGLEEIKARQRSRERERERERS